MSYVDGYLIAIPKKHLAQYKRLARLCAKVWVELGAEEYVETIGDELKPKGFPFTFGKAINQKPSEVLIFAWITYKDKRTRDRVNKAIMTDPRIEKMMKTPMPFKMERMAFGGFKPIVEEF